LGGDLIIKLDDKEIRSDDDLTNAVADDKPGQTVKVTFVRAGKTKTVDVTLGERPAQAPGQP
ncbi:MAG TPA: PDZ domain-containing protein, partial [Solirubrobacteraceae bacterium]